MPWSTGRRRRPATRPTPGLPRAISPRRCSSAATGRRLPAARPSRPAIPLPGSRWPRSRTRVPPISMRRFPPPPKRCPNGRRLRAISAQRSSTPSAAPCSATSACSRCWNRSTMASRSAKAATSMCRWLSAISSTMPAGRRRWTRIFPDKRASASSARSSRGISRS